MNRYKSTDTTVDTHPFSDPQQPVRRDRSSDNCYVSHTSCVRRCYFHAEMQVAALQWHVTKDAPTTIVPQAT